MSLYAFFFVAVAIVSIIAIKVSTFGLIHLKWTQAAKDSQAPPAPFQKTSNFVLPNASQEPADNQTLHLAARTLRLDLRIVARNLPFMHACASVRFHNLRRPCRSYGTYATLIHGAISDGDFATHLVLELHFKF
jgi:hypothetical protein